MRLPQPPEGKTGWPWFIPADTNSTDVGTVCPPITVVTPSYNQGEYLEETIRSVLLQGYPNLQYIVVDGESSDRSAEVLDKYAAHITHLIREPDTGQSDAIAKGLNLATGKFFNWINSDDMLLPGVLMQLGNHFVESYDLYTFRVLVRGETCEPYTMQNHNLTAKGILRADSYSFSQPGLWFRTQRVRECGGIDRNFNYGFDWDLLIRYLSDNHRVFYSTSAGAIFRLHAASKTMQETSKTESADNRFLQESHVIRLKLERTLSESLRRASVLGRQREPWNNYLVDMLDSPHQSPFLLSLSILGQVLVKPRARCSTRTFGSIARLLSRYVRPKFYRSQASDTR